MSRVVVTGAGGYIGSVLVPALLDAGHRVTAVDRFLFGRDTVAPHAALTICEGDIREVEAVLFEGHDAVIDLAALSNDPAGELDPDRTWAINHRARVRVARLAKAAGVRRYILPSSCSVYGFQEGILTEESPVHPLTTYARANLQAERDVLPMANDEFCVVVLRLATVYGYSPRMRFDLAINGMVRGLVKHGKIPILRDGTQWRPFVHVGDVATVMIRMLEVPVERVSGQIINVGSDDQNVQILPLARVVAEAVGVPFVYEWYGSPDHRSYRVSFRKLGDVLGYGPRFTPAEGAREVYKALLEGRVDPDDPRTITVGWYKHLLEEGMAL